jgi:hypothetical protein
MDGTGIDRRTIIKRAAAGGALVWTAPVILDSLASPAAAITCTSACVRVQFPPFDGVICNASSEAVGASCTTTSPNCSNTTNLVAGFTYGNVCITPVGSCFPSDAATGFNLDTSSTTCFTATGASCPDSRQFLAAEAGTIDDAGNTGCVTGTIVGGSQVQFIKLPTTTWTFFRFLIGCSCS